MTATLCIDGCFAQLGEGPSWHERLRTLFWVDMAGGKLFSFNPSTSVTKQFYIGRRITSVHPVNGQTNGVLLVFNNSIEYFVHHLDLAKTESTPLLVFDHQETEIQFNDTKIDSCGRLWLGTMHIKHTAPRGALFVLENHILNRKSGPFIISNGMAWSLDNKTFYHIDSAMQRIFVHDYSPAKAELSNRRTLFVAPKGEYPDGMTIDSDGMLWVAYWGGGCVRQHHGRTGEVLCTITLPVRCVTSVCFGGIDLEDLYITTAKGDRNSEEEPLAGGLFVVKKLCCRGIPSLEFDASN